MFRFLKQWLGKISPVETKVIDLGGGVRMDLVWCPPGEFTMGSPSNEDGRESYETQHMVTLTKGFWLGKIPVTRHNLVYKGVC